MSWVISAFADEAGPSTQEQIAALARAGLKHIDLRAIEGHNVAVLPLDVAERVRRKQLDAAGVKVAMFGSPLGKIDIADDLKIDLDKLAHLGEALEVLGCGAVRIFSYYNKQSQPADRWEAETIHRLKRLKDLAGDLGLTLYHENERHIWGDELAKVQKLVPLRDERFRLIFDFDNYHQSGQDVWKAWLALREVTDAFHLKDSDAANQHVPVGQGAGRVRDILADALARGWKGPLSLEPHLKHSGAVAATGPSGKANASFKDMSAPDSFQAAAVAATNLLASIKAPVA